jgi:two-component sensor histidine kinase
MDRSGVSERTARDLIREANHRIANQLSMLTGMIQLQIDSLANGPDQVPRERVLDLLRNAASRIVAIGNLNRQLAAATGPLIDLCTFLSATRAEMLASLGAESRVTACENLEKDCYVTGEQASVLCLVMNEIIVNALKHAHPPDHPLVLTLKCNAEHDTIVVEIADDGVGLPVDFDENHHAHMGFRLIRNLLRQIGARLELQHAGPGLKFRIAVPRAAA